uniref:Uncharacterized protein n=1 Tax=Solanum tuberosum TaxID=4113 RepID=M1AIL8_SOLTU
MMFLKDYTLYRHRASKYMRSEKKSLNNPCQKFRLERQDFDELQSPFDHAIWISKLKFMFVYYI